MSHYLYPIAALITFVGLFFKVVQLRRDPHNPALRAICGVLGGLGVAVLVGWAPCYVALDEATGIPNLARYLEHSFALVAAASVQSLFLYLGDPDKAPRRSRVRWVALAATILIMGVTFARAGFTVEATDDFAERYGATPQLGEYMMAFLAYVGLAMVDIYRMSLRYSRKLPRSLLRFGMRLLVAGSVIGVIYVVHKAVFIVVARVGGRLPWAEGPVAQVLVLSGIAFVAGGLVIPSVGTYVSDARRWPGRYRLYRDLYPLWEAIYSVNTAVNLHPPKRRPTIRLMSIALYRRVIEIRDGIRELNAHIDPDVTQAATRTATETGLPPDQARAVGEAAGIAAMLDYIAVTPPEARTPITTEGRNSAAEVAPANLETDARWLATVSRAYAQSPIVAERRATHTVANH